MIDLLTEEEQNALIVASMIDPAADRLMHGGPLVATLAACIRRLVEKLESA